MHPEDPGIADLNADPFFDAIRKAQPDEAMTGRWMWLKNGLDLLERRPDACRGDTPKAALLSGLQSCSIRSAHGLSVAFEASTDPDLPSVREIITYRLLDPREWVRFSACNMRDNSINLTDGTPMTQIIISRDDFREWAKDREEPYEEDDGVDHDPSSFDTTHESFIQKKVFAIKISKATIAIAKSRGGRPPVYNWSAVLVSFLVDALYRDTKIDSLSSPAQIAEAIHEAFGDPQSAPGTTSVKEYAAKIKAALVEKDKARQPQTRFRP